MRNKIIKQIEEEKIIAIIRGISPDKAVNVAQALYDGGINLLEVTFNQKCPENFSDTQLAIKSIADAMGDKMTVGAGTVITPEQAELARNAGAQFIVSPDTDEAVIKRTLELGMVSLPGAYTASEAKKAHNAGADFVKLFPCSDAGYLKALCAPLSHIRFLAVGGVTIDNTQEFLKAGACGIGVGSSLVNSSWVEAGDFYKITEQAKKFLEALK